MRFLWLVTFLFSLASMPLHAQKLPENLSNLVHSVRHAERQTDFISNEIIDLENDIKNTQNAINDYAFETAKIIHRYHSLERSPERFAFLTTDHSIIDYHHQLRTMETAKNIIRDRIHHFYDHLSDLETKKKTLRDYIEQRKSLSLSVNSLVSSIKNIQSDKNISKASIEEKIDSLQEKHNNLDSFISKLVTLPENITASYPTPPAFTLPVSGIIEPYNDGINIIAADNALVTTPSRGRILYADNFKNLGHIVIIDHGYNYLSILRGFKELTVQSGYIVKDGDPIGILGGDDWSKDGNRAIIRYQLRYNNGLINPIHKMTGL